MTNRVMGLKTLPPRHSIPQAATHITLASSLSIVEPESVIASAKPEAISACKEEIATRARNDPELASAWLIIKSLRSSGASRLQGLSRSGSPYG